MSDTVSPRDKSLALIRRIVSTLDDKKAGDIRIIDVSAQSGVTDFFVIATGTSDPHLRAIGNELEKTLDEDKVKIVGVESQPDSGWTVVDAFDVIVHLFRADQRANYKFEQLWKEGVELPAKRFIAPVASRPVSDQAVILSWQLEAALPEKKAPVAPKKTEKIIVKKTVVMKTSAVKSKPESEKSPNKKRTLKAAAKIAAKAKPAKGAKAAAPVAEPVMKTTAKPRKPVKAAVRKLIAKKEAKVAKTIRTIAKAKSKPAPKAKAPAKAAHKAGVITRKTGRR